ncbi:ADP-ribosylglycohydrolase family protein [Kitasatospora sp. NPDC088346]|uniref:ADP-ribosylglycohydrolase family protein n=1 Tax=Kitasatospora sp. NPDC088346 TaxID=3364073 RepID=UPI0037F83CF0
MTQTTDPALDSLHGLSVGDALGAQFFVPDNHHHLDLRPAPPGVWPWTDDTEMACSVHAAFTERGAVDTFDLTHAFARRHDFDRGYGPAANRLLRLVREGGDAPALAAALFDGRGSFGNGAAMRVAPLGAAFAADPAAVVRPAADTAVITHTHPQAVDGAIAVAVAAAHAVRARTEATDPAGFLRAVGELTPDGAVRRGIAEAARLLGADARTAARVLGNGSRVSAADTVPFALWAAARHLDDYPTAIRETLSAGGDVDTTAAIVGGIVAARTGTEGIPAAWLAAREPLPAWALPVPGSVAGPAGEPRTIRLPRPAPVPETVWSEEQWQRTRQGVLPNDPDGVWRAHTREGVLHLYLAAGGDALVEIAVEPVPGGHGRGWRPVSAVHEAHPAAHRGGAEGLVETLLRLL